MIAGQMAQRQEADKRLLNYGIQGQAFSDQLMPGPIGGALSAYQLFIQTMQGNGVKMYRKTDRYKNARAARARKREEGPSPEYPTELPKLRRRVIVIDYDFGEKRHEFELYRTNRIDCYRVLVDGRPWRERIGWSRILQAMRKSMPRVKAL